jgi:hypothetical protein
MGWITPLYFTAIKCRVKEVRLEAIRFLAHGDCKEGIWDAALASQVGRQVMTIEEEGPTEHSSKSLSVKVKADNEGPQLPPDSHRVFDVEVILPEGSSIGLGVVCKRRRENGSIETISRRRDTRSDQWFEEKV